MTWLAGQTQAVVMVDGSVQVDEKEEYGVITDLDAEDEDDITLAPPSVPAVPPVRGKEIPFQLRSMMSTYPTVLRVPPAAWVCQAIMSIYMDKIERDRERLAKGLPRRTLAEHVYFFYKDMLQLDVLADAQSAQLVKACEYVLCSMFFLLSRVVMVSLSFSLDLLLPACIPTHRLTRV